MTTTERRTTECLCWRWLFTSAVTMTIASLLMRGMLGTFGGFDRMPQWAGIIGTIAVGVWIVSAFVASISLILAIVTALSDLGAKVDASTEGRR